MERLAGRVLFLDGWRRALLTVAAGAVSTLALPPVDFPAAGFVGFPLLVWLLDGAAPDPSRSLVGRLAPSFATGWLFGFGYFVAGLWWLGAAMLVDASLFAVFIPFAVLVLPAILAVYFGLATLAARLLWPDSAWRIFALAATLALAEYLRGILFTGFPWNAIGVMAAPTPLLMQTTSLFGVTGLTLIAVLVFASPAVLADRHGRVPILAIAAALLAFHVGYGAWRLQTHPTAFVPNVALRVVQPNILQSLKWNEAEAQRIFQRHLKLTAERGDGPDATPAAAGGGEATPAADNQLGKPDGASARRTLVVWPESSFPFLLTQRPDAIAALADTLQPGETLVAGGTRLEGANWQTGRAYNSVFVIGDDGEILDARDKLHLVPFGEYLPFQSVLQRFGLTQIVEMPGGFSAGAIRSPVDLDGIPPFLALVCYEIIFPDEIDFGPGGKRPGFLLNVTNDAWYGNTPGPHQHLRLAELTAVAAGLPLVRSANTGISVVSDAYGREVAGLALGSTGVIRAELPQAAKPTVFARFGEWPFWLMFAVTCVVAMVARLTIQARID